MKKTINSKTIQNFLNIANISYEQFLGKTEIPGSLDLESLTEIPKEFNPTVGGSLYLESLTEIPKEFNIESHQNKDVNFLRWGDYILCDGRFSEIINEKGNLFKLKDVNVDNEYFLVKNGNKYAHGKTVSEAKEDLIYKIENRDKSKFVGLDINKKFPFEKCIEIYRTVTGACSEGVKHFITNKELKDKSFTLNEISKITIGQYGNNDFNQFFKIDAE